MLYLLGCVGSNAFAIGGKKQGTTNHLIRLVSRGGSSSSITNTALQQSSSPFEHQHNNTPLIYQGGHICVRLARKSDVPQIQKCNLATLPENYNANFYVNHMRQWPDLALVAEHIPEGYDIQHEIENGVDDYEDYERITPLREYISNKRRKGGPDHHHQQQQQKQPKKEIVGYILGKVEDHPVNPIRQIFPSSRVPPLYDEEDTLLHYMDGGSMNQVPPSQQQQRRQSETWGIVTSIAVHSHARRLGIASSLLDQVHYHLGLCYQVKSVGLHVRISNQAAVKLYCERLGYDVADIIPFYYRDGEDAYFMRKDLFVEDAGRRVDNGGSFEMGRPSHESRDDWINGDVRKSGSFFDNRRSMRDSLSPDERSKQYNSTPRPASQRSSIGGQFKRSFQTFLNGGDPTPTPPPQGSRSWDRPVWETRPEYLRLPRCTKILKTTPGERIGNDAARAPMEYEQRVAS